jgi:beta-lactamase class A
MLDSLKKWLFLLLLSMSSFYLLYEGLLYYQSRHLLPAGTIIAGLDVSGDALDAAMARVVERYATPIAIYHRNERTDVNPADLGFVLDLDNMRYQVEQQLQEQDFWYGFAGHLLQRPLQAADVPLMATHDPESAQRIVQMIAGFLDQPARAPQLISDAESFEVTPGHDGYITDTDASLPEVEAVLYRSQRREAHLIVVEEEAPALGIESLGNAIQRQLQEFNGVGSVYVLDLQTGEEISINGDVALTASSILKIAIFVEAYRALDAAPTAEQQRLFYETAALSSNFAANSLLHIVAGQPNTYRGADILTESMQRLGLVNTFMVVPYDAPAPAHRPTTLVTPANSRPGPVTEVDPARQMTAEDIGTLLAMIYYCAKGGGTLLAVYPGQITPEECQAIIDLMILNEEGNLIRFGVPDGTPVSHKHGWVAGNHGDAGIVLTPGGDFVLVEYLHQPGGWLVADVSFPILREIARLAYNYFNMDDPYLGEAIFERERFDPDDPFFQQLDRELEDGGAPQEELEETSEGEEDGS